MCCPSHLLQVLQKNVPQMDTKWTRQMDEQPAFIVVGPTVYPVLRQ